MFQKKTIENEQEHREPLFFGLSNWRKWTCQVKSSIFYLPMRGILFVVPKMQTSEAHGFSALDMHRCPVPLAEQKAFIGHVISGQDFTQLFINYAEESKSI